MAPDVVFCADDFTGASDTLATLARAGLSTRLFLRASEAVAAARSERLHAVGVATSLRAMTRAEARTTMEEIAPQLASLGARFAHFKICSTFDSSPDVGNVCEAADIFAAALGTTWTAIVGGQPSLGRYCVFGNLFAAAGDGIVHRIDRHPTMSVHPITPMTEADLRMHLGRQGWGQIGLIDCRAYASEAAGLKQAIEERLDRGERRTLFDVADEGDLTAIGDALISLAVEHPVFCVGASSVAEALCGTGRNTQPSAELQKFDGPVFALAGSRSIVTANQVANAGRYRLLVAAPDDFLSSDARAELAETCRSRLAVGQHVLVQLSKQQNGTSGRDLAAATGRFIQSVVGAVRPGCLAIAGGDTSSAAMEHLGIDSISFIADFDRGVPLVRAHSRNGVNSLPMVLKGGQVGGVDLFDRLAGSSRV